MQSNDFPLEEGTVAGRIRPFRPSFGLSPSILVPLPFAFAFPRWWLLDELWIIPPRLRVLRRLIRGISQSIFTFRLNSNGRRSDVGVSCVNSPPVPYNPLYVRGMSLESRRDLFLDAWGGEILRPRESADRMEEAVLVRLRFAFACIFSMVLINFLQKKYFVRFEIQYGIYCICSQVSALYCGAKAMGWTWV